MSAFLSFMDEWSKKTMTPQMKLDGILRGTRYPRTQQRGLRLPTRLDIHDAPGHSLRVIAGEVAQYDPAPEHKGVIAVRESREPEGAGVTNNLFRDVQTRLDGEERPAHDWWLMKYTLVVIALVAGTIAVNYFGWR